MFAGQGRDMEKDSTAAGKNHPINVMLPIKLRNRDDAGVLLPAGGWRGKHRVFTFSRTRKQPETQTIQQTRWQGLQILHSLWGKSLPVAIVQKSIIRKSCSG